MNNEIWKDIEGYEGLYQVSSYGRVRSLNYRQTGRTKILKPRKDRGGYLSVILCKDGEMKNFIVHRLVATAFIENLKGKPQVNHKDENKENNRVDNLEWMSHKENINYGTRNEQVGRALSKPVLQYTKDGVFVKEFPSMKEAERQTNIPQGNISNCCLGKIKQAGKYIWKYKEEDI